MDAANTDGAAVARMSTGEDHEEHGDSGSLKGVFARNAAKVTPAVLAWAKRAKMTAALLAARARRAPKDDAEIPPRRTTAPAPGGGLHASGRKVVRGSSPDLMNADRAALRFEGEEEVSNRFKITKKKVAIAGTIGVAGVLVFIALKKPPAAAQPTPPPEVAAASVGSSAPAASPSLAKTPVPPPTDPLAAAAAAMTNGPSHGTRSGKPVPFTNGPVGAHPTIIKIKMDGMIEGILGATQPTGFTVVTPNRKSMDPTNALADRDARIANVQVSNEPSGAEFAVTFKDGVPNYLVRAHGDTLELVLAGPTNHAEKSEAHAKKKHGKKRP
jgi:hypothetical protein